MKKGWIATHVSDEEIPLVNGKEPLLLFCRGCWRDWSARATSRRVLLVATLIVSITLFAQQRPAPHESDPGSAEQFRLRSLEDRVDKIDPVVSDMAVARARLGDLESRIARIDPLVSDMAVVKVRLDSLQKHMDDADTKLWGIFLLVLAAFVERLLSAFGIKFRGGGESKIIRGAE